MKKIISKLSKSMCTVVLLLGVYGMHFFLFESLLVSKTEQVYLQHNHSSKHKDPSSVECRALFKYDDSRQTINELPLPIEDLLSKNESSPFLSNTALWSNLVCLNIGIYASKLFVLFGVFLI